MKNKAAIYTLLGSLLLIVTGIYLVLGTPQAVCNNIVMFNGGRTHNYLNLKTGKVQRFATAYVPSATGAPEDFICEDMETK